MKKTNSPHRLVGGVNKSINRERSFTVTSDSLAPKKLKSKTPLLGMDTVKKRGLSKTDKSNIDSFIGDSSEQILDLLEGDNSDSAVPLIYKKMLQGLVDILPYAENAVRKSEGAKGVYQINSLISSIREIMIDLQSAQDRGLLGQTLVDTILRPSYSDLAVVVLQEYKKIGDESKELALNVAKATTPEKIEEERQKFRQFLLDSRERMANGMTKQYKDSSEKIVNYLQR